MCDKCGAHVQVYESLKIYAVWKNINLEIDNDNKKQYLSPELPLKLFKRISNDDCKLMGLDYRWCG